MINWKTPRHHVLCGKTDCNLLTFFEQEGSEQMVSQVIQDTQGQQVTQAFQGLGFLETQVQKVKYTF